MGPRVPMKAGGLAEESHQENQGEAKSRLSLNYHLEIENLKAC